MLKHLRSITVNHLINDETTEDAIAIEAIMEETFERLSPELSDTRNVWVLTDNVSSCGNVTIPVLLPFLAKRQSFSVGSYIKLETQRGKGLMDAHFAVTMKYLNRFVNENQVNIILPSDVIDGLAFREELSTAQRR